MYTVYWQFPTRYEAARIINQTLSPPLNRPRSSLDGVKCHLSLTRRKLSLTIETLNAKSRIACFCKYFLIIEKRLSVKRQGALVFTLRFFWCSYQWENIFSNKPKTWKRNTGKKKLLFNLWSIIFNLCLIQKGLLRFGRCWLKVTLQLSPFSPPAVQVWLTLVQLPHAH